MKKTIILSSFFLLLLLLISGCSTHKTTPEETAKIRTQYYDTYKQKCNNDSCCLQTIGAAEGINADLYENKNPNDYYCPDGFISDKLRCSDNLHWCVKIITNPIVPPVVPPVENNQPTPLPNPERIISTTTTATTTN